jgi:copper chaperone NosL
MQTYRNSLINENRIVFLPAILIICVILVATCYLFAPALASEGRLLASQENKSDDPCLVKHPFDGLTPYASAAGVQCENCGMNRNMWARTRTIFHNSEGTHYTCSLHCMADMSARLGEPPKDVLVAVYLSPLDMIPAEQAYFVIGSKAPGTMTNVSKLAFSSKAEAEHFAAQCGGKVVGFTEALSAATDALAKDRQMIYAKRQKTGKIAAPSPDEHCLVCDMYPARYPETRAQVLVAGNKRIHFCSTHCLFQALSEGKVKPMAVWVTLRDSGRYDYAGSAYYVVGSRENGPMGLEAFPFETKQAAQAFAQKHGGKVMRFGEITYEEIMKR